MRPDARFIGTGEADAGCKYVYMAGTRTAFDCGIPRYAHSYNQHHNYQEQGNPFWRPEPAAYRRDLWRERWIYAGKLAAMLASGGLFAWILYGWMK